MPRQLRKAIKELERDREELYDREEALAAREKGVKRKEEEARALHREAETFSASLDKREQEVRRGSGGGVAGANTGFGREREWGD